MKTYRPGDVKSDELRRELNSIYQASQRADPYVSLQPIGTEPVKAQEGEVRYANGTGWNPGGTGKGWYGWDGSAWVKLG